MARIKGVAQQRKTSTSTMSGKRTYSTAGLNSRILAVLKTTQELKRRSIRVNYSGSGAGITDWVAQSDIFSAISVGAGLNQRVGDKIVVDRINITQRYMPQHIFGTDTNVISVDLRVALMSTSEGTTGTATMSAYVPFNPFVYNGFFPAIGAINAMDRKLIAFSDKHSDGNNFVSSIVAGVGALSVTNKLYKKFPKGLTIKYREGSTLQADTSVFLVAALDVPGRGASAAALALFCDFAIDIFYRDS